MNCELCGEPGEAYLCERDTRRLAGRLAVLPELARELAMHLVPARTGPAEHVSAAPGGSRPPISLAVFDELHGNRAGEVLHSWRVDVQRERWPHHAPPPPAGLPADCRWLSMELGWIAAEYPAAGELAREVRDLEAQLRSLVGDPVPRPQRLGLCVAVTDDKGTVCGAVLSRLPGQPVRCRWCRTEYRTETDLLLLAHYQPRESA
ncbi:hypothetical protein [Streptomyces sp. NPDC002265]|uniref:hypothetical protein n=1 Tax=Streptomyces sp. NPDC002265 TaxID=3154415 RepID=UPI0033180DC4